MSRHVFLIAVCFDVLCLALIAVLMWHGVVPRELGAGLLGTVIGVRAKWASDHHDGPRGGGAYPPELSRTTPTLGGRAEAHFQAPVEVVRGAISESTLGVLFGWARVTS